MEATREKSKLDTKKVERKEFGRNKKKRLRLRFYTNYTHVRAQYKTISLFVHLLW